MRENAGCSKIIQLNFSVRLSFNRTNRDFCALEFSIES